MSREKKAASSGNDGFSAVLGAVQKLDKILQDVPQDMWREFEEGVQKLMEERRASFEETDQHEDGRDRRGGKKQRRGEFVNPYEKMQEIKFFLRSRVPVEAVLPTETILYEHKGTEFESYNTVNTLSVDDFLYEMHEVDEMCDEGKIPRHYCKDCGSRRVEKLNFITHSLSIRELEFIFKTVLPSRCKLKDSTVLDVGSRLGAVLYGARLFGDVKEAVGVEVNEDLCKLQEETLKAFKMSDQARVICDDVRNKSDLLRTCQVVVLHNPFQFFSSKESALEAFHSVFASLSKGCLLVSCPSLDEQLANCDGTVADLSKFGIEELKLQYEEAEDEDDEYADDDGLLFSNIRLYKVS